MASKAPKLKNPKIRSKPDFELLSPPNSVGTITIADAPQTDSIDAYTDFAWAWARSAWNA